MREVNEVFNEFFIKYVMPKKVNKIPLPMAEGDRCFWINNGPVICSIKELSDVVEDLSDEQIQHHIRPDRNDFAAWVREVFSDEEAAKALERAKTGKGLRHGLELALKKYNY